MGNLRVANGRTELEFDEATGSIVAIRDRHRGLLFDALGTARDGRLLRVLVPLDTWSSHHADSQTSPPPVINRTADGATIHWTNLAAANGPSGIEALIRVSAGQADELQLSLTLTNHGDRELTDVMFPWIGAWVEPAGEAASLVLGGVRKVDPRAYPKNRSQTLGRWHQRDFWTYPRDLYCPWIDIATADGGVGIISYQRNASILGVFADNLADFGPGLELSLGLAHFIRVPRGGRWESPPISVFVHDDDWHATADRYSGWVDTWFQAPPTPRWARTAVGFQNILFRSQDGTPWRRFAEIPALAEAGIEAGVPHLTVWDVALAGPDPGFWAAWGSLTNGDRDELRAALKRARAGGARLSVIQNYRIVWPGSQFYRGVAASEIAVRYDGTPFVEEYEYSWSHPMFQTQHVGPMFHSLDPRAPGYRDRVLQSVRDTLDLGFDSLFWDQPFMDWPSYRSDVGASQPGDVHAATIELIGDVRRLIRDRHEEGMLLGEFGDAFGNQAIDLWMSWAGEIEGGKRVAEGVSDFERAAFSVPRTMQSVVVDADPGLATRAIGIGAQLCLTTHGMTGSLADVPEFAGHVKALAALRARSADRLVDGRYRAQEGIVATVDGPVTLSVFRSPAGPCVAVASPGEAGRATIWIDPEIVTDSAGDQPDGGRILRFDGTDTATDSMDAIDIELGANEIAIWFP